MSPSVLTRGPSLPGPVLFFTRSLRICAMGCVCRILDPFVLQEEGQVGRVFRAPLLLCGLEGSSQAGLASGVSRGQGACAGVSYG